MRRPAQFWEHDLPLQMTELAAQLEPGHRFDSIVVDEAQDFADAWWDPLLAALKDDETGGLYVFTDEGQRVFNRHGSPPVPFVPLILDHNLRNTRQIANAFQPLVDHPMRFLGGEGPAVKFVACAREDAMNAGDDEVELLLEEGWRPEDVALLTTGTRHPEQKERQAAGSAAYWDSFWDAEQVFYGHVLGFKGLERRAVVLVVNEESAFERSRERLYVGLSRARDQLVVCGDPGVHSRSGRTGPRSSSEPIAYLRQSSVAGLRWCTASAGPSLFSTSCAPTCVRRPSTTSAFGDYLGSKLVLQELRDPESNLSWRRLLGGVGQLPQAISKISLASESSSYVSSRKNAAEVADR